jgi:hypothetical protein
MTINNRTLRTLLLASALCLAAAWLPGCGKKPGQLAATETSDTLSAIADTFTDTRDGQKYRVIKMGNQRWMARNLNYDRGATFGSWCYW